MFQNKTIMALSAAGLLFVSAAHADGEDAGYQHTSDPAEMKVTLTIEASCTINVSEMPFGTVTADKYQDATAQATANVTCTKGTPYSLQPQEDKARTMKRNGGNETIAYTLYTDESNSNDFKTTKGHDIEATGTGKEDPHIIYGKADPATLADAPVGTYEDTAILVVKY
ncbi:spore coat U domain-containing protein [Pluralibacter gergoviae]|uniref:Csu type fimbrial protein n=1 Tax=Pluralibacter gergoviae TaxID=61647 RepID=UPI0006AC9D46|nr:spore coat protein U domain-containing protein [Pluralibacter gergoviae]